MRPTHRIGAASASVAAAAVLSLGAGGASAASPAPAPESGCFWSIPIDVNSANVGFPNGTITNYWYDTFTLPAGAKVVLRGTYPSARYMSLNSYFSSATDPAQRGIATDAVYDEQIAPDPGSTNPFVAGAKRTPNRKGRAWTLTVSGATPPADPADRAPNTLYAGTRPAGESQPVELLYRIYTPDKGYDVAGGGGVPQATVVLADGTELTGQAACDAVDVQTAPPVPNTMPLNQYLALSNIPANPGAGLPGSSPQAPATDPPQWYRPINPCMFQYPFFQAAGYPVPACPSTPGLTQWPTKDNAYITSYVDRRFGPAADGRNVVVMTGKMPSTPRTYRRNPFFQGGKQLRYWGVCTNESLLTTKATVNDGCAYDEQIPVDRQGRYTIVISTPEDRPANATARCNVAWLDWGKGDGAPAPFTKPTSSLIILRNLIPDPSFAQAAQNIPAPGLPAQVSATMGEYLPKLEYQSPTQFQARGCRSTPPWQKALEEWRRSVR